MGNIRRLTVVAGCCALVGVLVAGPATAASPEVYAGSAEARALDLTILGQKATLGATKATAESTLKASAEGTGQLVPVVPASPTVKAAVEGGGADVKPNTCGPLSAPAALSSVLTLGVACAGASASVVAQNPVSSSEASVASLGVSANTVLSGPLAPITGPVQSGLAQLLGSIPGGTPIDPVVTTLEDLVVNVLKTPTLDVSAGKSTSAVTTAAGTVTSESTAAAVIIKLLPLPQVNGAPTLEPAATITVGKASATATYDRTKGTSTAKFQPALVSIKFNTALTASIPALANGIEIAPNVVAPASPLAGPCADDATATCILVGTALESRIKVANGTTTSTANSASAVADGVRLELLKGVNGGVILNLARAQAAVGGTLAVVDSPAVEAPRVDELPRTGGTPMIPLAGAGVLGLAVLVRRAVARAAR